MAMLRHQNVKARLAFADNTDPLSVLSGCRLKKEGRSLLRREAPTFGNLEHVISSSSCAVDLRKEQKRCIISPRCVVAGIVFSPIPLNQGKGC